MGRTIPIGEDTWLEPLGWLGTIEGFEKVEDGITITVFIPDDGTDTDEEPSSELDREREH